MYSPAIKPSSYYTTSNQCFFIPKKNPIQRVVSYISFSFLRANLVTKKPQNRSFRVSCKANQKGLQGFRDLPINLFSLLTPFLQKGFMHDPSLELGYVSCGNKASILHNGGLGMALLIVKSTAKDTFSPFLATLAGNPIFVSGLLAMVLAQSVKTLLNFLVERKWDFRVVCASGGMPSTHSALCTALTTSVALCHGVADGLFPVCLGFSLVVMYDAIGVRRHAGMQAEVLNKIIEDLFQGHPISERKLKELLGHTLSQVVVGALLGMIVAWFCCQGCLVPI